MLDIKFVLEEYIPTLDEADVEDLVKFSVELFCAENNSEVNND